MAMNVGPSEGGEDETISTINTTPLVDVMLVLLIIMMLIAPMLQQGVTVRLPVAENTADKPSSQDQTMIAIAPNGDVYLNAKPVQKGELATKVTELLESKKEKLVLIRADTDAQYGAVMGAMDELRQAGIEDIGLITDPKKGAESSAGGR